MSRSKTVRQSEPSSRSTDGGGRDATTSRTDSTPEREAAEYEAVISWLSSLDPRHRSARVVAQEVRDVADAVDQLRAAEAAVDAAVLRARRAGASWNDLALPLGVSRQAARQRYARLEQAAPTPA